MNKTITINLAGIVFHIDEDAFEMLNAYLQEVKAYFGNLEGGTEIQGDIEARIAEIFLSLLNESRQAIHKEDVESVIHQLGTVRDIAGEEEESGAASSGSAPETESDPKSETGPRRLVRDSSNALVGGVCSGLAAYFEINPLWVRLATLALFFGFSFIPAFSGTIFISYLVLWVAMPPQANLENKGKFRKFLRSRKDKVLGGVAGGLGTFFNIEPVLVRVAFVVFLFAGGSGFLAYLILWALTPEAKTVSDELEMKGNPVTLTTIEEEIKAKVNSQDPQKENVLATILLFPFRVLSQIFKALGPVVKAIFSLFRWFIALILFFLGISILASIVLLTGVSLGFWENLHPYVHLGDFPVGLIQNELSPLLVLSGAVAALVPVLAILLVSVSLFFKQSFIKPILVLILTGVFLLAALGFGIGLVPVIARFSHRGSVTRTESFPSGFGMLHLRLQQEDEDDPDWKTMLPVQLTIHGKADSLVVLRQVFRAQGKTKAEARNFASEARYNFVRMDSVYIFPKHLSTDSLEAYRVQRLHLHLYIPHNLPFTMDPELEEILLNTLHPYGYKPRDLEGNIWVYTPEGLICTTCPTLPKRKKGPMEEELESMEEEINMEMDPDL